MRTKTIIAGLIGFAAASLPMFGSGGTFNFTSGTNNSNDNGFSVTSTGGDTATAYAFYTTGTSTGVGSSNLIGPTTSGSTVAVGEYNGAGIGVCENPSNSTDCASPNHQVNNGTNTSTTTNSGTTYDYEFILIAFNTPVNLNQIQLGNYGTTGTATNPFDTTYFTSGSTASVSSIESALEGTSVGSIAGVDGFSSASSGSCTSGLSALGAGGNGGTGTYTDNCAVNGNAVENMTGSNITYLLIGASTTTNIGSDFFKIQDISYTNGTSNTSTPEPATFGLIGSALVGLGLLTRKRKLTN